MVVKETILQAALGTGILAIVVIMIFRCYKKQKSLNNLQLSKVKSLEKGTTSSHAPPHVVESARWRPSLQGFRRGGMGNKSLFNWADNQSLMTGAVESGWVRFAFTLLPSVKPTSLLEMCAAGESSSCARETEISWEISHEALDFMQKIRLNPGIKSSWFQSNTNFNSNLCIMSAIRTALPLPGPACAFPQEAYFEINILSCRVEDEEVMIMEGERMKLINEHTSGELRLSDANILATSENEESRNGSGGLLVAVGLTVGGFLPMKLPGSYPGSIGFVSNGSLHRDGNKLVSEWDKGDWGQLTGKVVGCGYDPSQKKVIFTVDGELVHTITCTTEEFGAPLYPTIAANCDITALVNNGQSPFKYSHANAKRCTNPCFLAKSQGSTIIEDSRELFSIGRIDSQWRGHSAPRYSVYAGNDHNSRVKEYDEETDVDELFEIILEGKNSSSSTIGR